MQECSAFAWQQLSNHIEHEEQLVDCECALAAKRWGRNAIYPVCVANVFRRTFNVQGIWRGGVVAMQSAMSPGEVGRRDHGFLQTIKVEVDYIFSKTRRSMHCLLPFSCRSIDHNHIINPPFFQFSSHNAPNLMSYYSGEDPDAASTDPAPNVLSNDIRLDEQSR
jgi:hypothetical protein